MFGWFFAAFCAAGLYKLWRPRHGPYGFGRWAHAGAGRGCGGHAPGPMSRLEWLIRDLNANAEQEAAIRQSAEEIRSAFAGFAPGVRLRVVADALTAAGFDRHETRGQLGSAGDAVADAVANAVERLRATLTEDQRRKLASKMTRSGWGCR